MADKSTSKATKDDDGIGGGGGGGGSAGPDELFLGDGFSIVDSTTTKQDGTTAAVVETKPTTTTVAADKVVVTPSEPKTKGRKNSMDSTGKTAQGSKDQTKSVEKKTTSGGPVMKKPSSTVGSSKKSAVSVKSEKKKIAATPTSTDDDKPTTAAPIESVNDVKVEVASSETISPVKSDDAVAVTTNNDDDDNDDDTTLDTSVVDDGPEKDDGSKGNGQNVDVKSGITLIITTEEDLDADLNSTCDKSVTDQNKKTKNGTGVDVKAEIKSVDESIVKVDNGGEAVKDNKTDKKKGGGGGDLWVSNITRHVKATDLKKHFSRIGKVLTAKIVTNGKLFFGFILMEDSELAGKCVRNLNGSMFDKRKISVSRQRPDAQKKQIRPEQKKSSDNTGVISPKKEDKSADESTPISADKKNNKAADSSSVAENAAAKAQREKVLAQSKDERKMTLYRREITRLKGEVQNWRKYFTTEQTRCRLEVSKNRRLERNLHAVETKLREERRKFDRDREIFEKNTRTDRMKLESDRANIKKELDEVKKVREYLKRKLDEEQARTVVERRTRQQSPPYAFQTKRYREDVAEKNVKSYHEGRTRTPTPPKLSSSRKRSPLITASYMIEKDRRPSSHHYEMSSNSFNKDPVGRHSNSMVMTSKPQVPAAPRNIWPSTFHQEVWRMGPGTGGGSSGGGGGGGGGSQFTSDSFSRQSSYHHSPQTGGGKTPNYSQQREFNKRDHYNNVRKY